jgi:hypothetical protein
MLRAGEEIEERREGQQEAQGRQNPRDDDIGLQADLAVLHHHMRDDPSGEEGDHSYAGLACQRTGRIPPVECVLEVD